MALSKIDVANMLTGATPVANGGTGLTSGTTDQFLKFTGSTTLASAADNAGTVKQIITAEDNTETSSNSQSLTDTGLSATITLSSTSSKCLVLVNQRIDLYGGANIDDLRFSWRIRRDVSGGSNTYIRDSGVTYDQGVHTEGHANDNIFRGFMTQSVIDSPSSTAALTYKTFMVEHSSSALITSDYVYGGANSRSTMILMEF
jgi:hypothetical protein